jgi:hypothetical protein
MRPAINLSSMFCFSLTRQYYVFFITLLVLLSSSFMFFQSFVLWPLSTPYWDQWDSEYNLLISYINHKDILPVIFTPHNEHFIVLHKVLVLNIFIWLGVWSVEVEKLFAILTQGLTYGILTFRLTNHSTYTLSSMVPLLLIINLYFLHPWHWENFLFGFQVQIFIHTLCTISAIVSFRPQRSAWNDILVYGFVLLSFLSFASGIVTTAVFLCVYVLRLFKDITQSRYRRIFAGHQSWVVVIYTCTFLTELYLTPTVSGHASLRPNSLVGFFTSLDQVYSFPLKSSYYILPFLYLLLGILGIKHSWQSSNEPALRTGWLLFLYATGTSFLISIGRGLTASRYNWQLMYLVLSLACILHGSLQINNSFFGFLSKSRLLTLLYTLLLIISLARLPADYTQAEKRWIELSKTDQYFINGIPEVINPAIAKNIYPDYNKLSDILNSKDFQLIMPLSMRSSFLDKHTIEPQTVWVNNGVYPTTPTNYGAYGSYNAAGDAAVGCTSVFVGPLPSDILQITYAGYPARMHKPLLVSNLTTLQTNSYSLNNSGELWSSVILKLKTTQGDLSKIVVCDDNVSSWWAVASMKSVYQQELFIERILNILKQVIWFIVSLVVGTIFWHVLSKPSKFVVSA